MKSIYFVGIIAALTIIAATVGGFGFIQASAQTTADNATSSGNMTSGSNATMTGQSGNISGIENPGL